MKLSRKKLDKLLYKLSYLGSGSQGTCYLDKESNTVYKVFHTYSDREFSGYRESDLIWNVSNGTYLFPKEAIIVNKKIEGYTLDYFKGYDLCRINPFKVDLDNFQNIESLVYKDIDLISEKGILSFDVLYNIMYSKDKLAVVDTLDYSIGIDTYKTNRYNFDYSIKMFLVDSYFDYFINNSTLLKAMYNSKDVSALEFLKMFRYMLSECMGCEIKYLGEASSLVRRSTSHYIRG